MSYFIFNAVKTVMATTDVYVVENGTVASEETVDAYVIRNEIILQGNNYKNGMEKIIVEGNRVAKGDPVFRYYVNGEDTIKNEIAELDKQIEEAQKSEPIISNSDIEILQSKIKDLEEKIYKTNSVEEISNYKKEIEENKNKIASIIGEISPKSSDLKKLVNKKNKILKKLTDGAEEIKAKESGTVSYRIDNLEEIFTTKNFKYLTKDFLEELNLKTGETNDEKGKIITQFNCYLAIIMNSESAKKAKVEDKVKIELDMDTTVNATIVKINDSGDDRVLVFEIDDLPEKLINYRKVSVNVIWWQEKGLKVPKSALIEENGKYYLERNRAGFDVNVLVKVLNQNDSYAIVNNFEPSELQEMGYTYKEIQNMYVIKQYDKIKIQK